MADENLKAVIEALVFASEKPITIEQIRTVVDNIEPVAIRQVLEEIKNDYETSNRGLRIVEVAGGFQITTPAALAPFLKKMFKQRRAERLSKPALETLAIIAYKQPVTKFEIQSLRNVNVDGMMANLLEKNLIRIAGRKKAPGRPHVFGTTRQFLEYFGLKSLDELPKLEDFSKLSPKLEADMPQQPAAGEPEPPAGGIEGGMPQTEGKDGVEEAAPQN